MEAFNTARDHAISSSTAPATAAIAITASGETLSSLSFGPTSTALDAPTTSLDSVMWVASCTKLLTSISALQLVERGLIKLDDTVEKVLPEFKDIEVLSGYDSAGKAEMKKVKRAPTLRELLTHSSGLGYTGMEPVLGQWWAGQGNAPDISNSSVKYSYTHPLRFEPGEGWMYGCGLDWVGKIVERISGKSRLGDYFEENVWGKLGVSKPLSTFRPTVREEVMGKLVEKTMRGGDGKLVEDQSGMFPVVEPEDDYGGNGYYTNASEYILVLKSLLLNDGKLLKPETRDLLFTPCLTEKAKVALNETLKSPFVAYLAPGYPKAGGKVGAGGEELVYEYALGGDVVVNEGGVQGRCDQGMIYWAGMPNSYWFIDPSRGVAGVYLAQHLPPADPGTQKLYQLWHEGVYDLAS